MTGFLNLPNEIIAMTIQHLDPADMDTVLYICQHIRAVAFPFYRKHSKHKVKYSCWRSGVLENGEPATCVSQLLRDVLLQPRIGLYVQGLIVDGWLSNWDPDSDPAGQVRLYVSTEEDLTLFRTALQESLYVAADQVERWMRNIRSGDEQPLLALLLTLLPNLDHLNICLQTSNETFLLDTILRISAANRTSDTPTPLSKLRYLHLQPDDRRLYIQTRILWPFLTLPSIKKVTLQRLCQDNSAPSPSRSSNVTKLLLIGCCLDALGMDMLLGTFKALQDFALYSSLVRGRRWQFDGLGLRRSLHAHTRHSLEKLFVIEHNGVYRSVQPIYQFHEGGFLDFSALTDLRIEIGLLMNLDPAGACRNSLADVLPASVISVTVIDAISIVECRRLVFEMLRAKESSFPKLRALEFVPWNPLAQWRDDEMQHACREAGISLELDGF